MQTDLETARWRLKEKGCTCVLCRETVCYESHTRGIAPLLDFLDSGMDMHGFSAADKVVGRGAAFLYCLLGIHALYAPVISRDALEILESRGIRVVWQQITEGILNRKKNGLCPMETATAGLTDPRQALQAMRHALETMK